MATNNHQTFVYAGLAGEGEYIGDGGLYRLAAGSSEWEDISQGLPPHPQVRALVMHPKDPAVLYAGTQWGPYRSDDRGRALGGRRSPSKGTDVWSLAFHPQDPTVIYAGYDPCAIYRSERRRRTIGSR